MQATEEMGETAATGGASRRLGIIPARYASSRFPGKPLALILGRPMFWHVHRQAMASGVLDQVVLATDDERIAAAARELDVPVLMTAADHPSGTDRVREAARMLGAGPEDVVVNIQGDEPGLDPRSIAKLVALFDDPGVEAATLAHPVSVERAQSPDQVKVVLDREGRALYFSRAAIPHGAGPDGFLGHIGMYGLRMRTLERFADLPPGRLEQLERLEQLRLLENGIALHVALVDRAARGVDRPEDLVHVTRELSEQPT